MDKFSLSQNLQNRHYLHIFLILWKIKRNSSFKVIQWWNYMYSYFTKYYSVWKFCIESVRVCKWTEERKSHSRRDSRTSFWFSLNLIWRNVIIGLPQKFTLGQNPLRKTCWNPALERPNGARGAQCGTLGVTWPKMAARLPFGHKDGKRGHIL